MGKVYGDASPTLSASYSGFKNGETVATSGVTGSPALSTAATASSPVGGFAITAAPGTLAATNYAFAFVNGTLTVTRAALTITADDKGKVYGAALPAFTAIYSGFVLGEGPAVLGGTLSFSTPVTAASTAGTYPITPAGQTADNYSIAYVPGTLTVNPADTSTAVSSSAATSVVGQAVTFTATVSAQAPGAGTPIGTVAFYDGTNLLGTATLSGGTATLSTASLTQGSHAITVAYGGEANFNASTSPALTQTVNSSQGSPVGPGQSAGIGFWHNKNGQALIAGFNGGSTSTALANWLAATLPNLCGSGAGANNLAGRTNAQVAAFYQALFNVSGQKLDAQVFATALNVYATTLSLGGTAAAAYGFTVTAAGVGACTWNVGTSGAAFGVANDSVLSVLDILRAANDRAVGGVLYGGNRTLRNLANAVFDGINQAGDIVG
jgi:hypothetical protein